MKENDNIEKYFQKRLKNDAFSFEEAHWDQLEAQLDKALPTASAPKLITKSRLILIVLLAAILAFLMGWFFKEMIFEDFTSSQQATNNTEIALDSNEQVSEDLNQREDIGFLLTEKDSTSNLRTADDSKSVDDLQKNGILQSQQETKGISLDSNEQVVNDSKRRKDLDLLITEKGLTSNSLSIDDSKAVDDSQQAGILQTQQKTTNITLDSSTTKNETTTINNLNTQKTEIITNNPDQIREEKNIDVISTDLNITKREEIEAKRNEQDIINNQNGTISKENLQGNNVQETINNNEQDESIAVPVEKNDLLLTITPFELQLLPDSSTVLFGLAKRFIVTEKASNSSSAAESLRSKWGLSLTLAPDFSNTSTGDLFSSLGNAIGLRLDYQIFSRFRLAVGTTLGRKLYLAPNSDYSPPMGFWTDGVRPEEIDANCLILEVPISVGYHLLNIKKTSIWVNTAIASQFMLREDYDYIYATENPDLVQRWSGRNENNHLFSALSFSISLQRQLLRNWDGFIEPYFGSPLKGIGHGKVNLLGTGVNIGVRYSFNKKSPSI